MPAPPEASEEAAERRAVSIARLDALGLPTNPDAPHLMDSAELPAREPDAVADRAIAVALTAIKGERDDQTAIADAVAEFGDRASFTPRERTFIDDAAAEMQTRIDFSWRFECLHVLLWSLGLLDELARPNVAADIGVEVTLVLAAGTEFGLDASLRDTTELLNEADYYAQLLWAGRMIRAGGGEVPDAMDYSIVYERLRALRWLTAADGRAWDDVTLETP